MVLNHGKRIYLGKASGFVDYMASLGNSKINPCDFANWPYYQISNYLADPPSKTVAMSQR